MARFKPKRGDKKSAQARQAALPCFVLLALVFILVSLVFFFALRGQ